MSYINPLSNGLLNDPLYQIFEYLPEKDLFASSKVCKTWQPVAEKVIDNRYKELFLKCFENIYLYPPKQELISWKEKFLFNKSIQNLTKKGWSQKIATIVYKPFSISQSLSKHDSLGEPIVIQRCGPQQNLLLCEKLSQGQLITVSYQSKNFVINMPYLKDSECIKYATYSGENHFLLIKNFENNSYYLAVHSSTERICKTWPINISLEGLPTCLASGKNLVIIATNKGKVIGWKISDLKDPINRDMLPFSYSLSHTTISSIGIQENEKGFNFFAMDTEFLISGTAFSPESVKKTPATFITGHLPSFGGPPFFMGINLFWSDNFGTFHYNSSKNSDPLSANWKTFIPVSENKILVQNRNNNNYETFLIDENANIKTNSFTTTKKIISSSLCENLLAVAYEGNIIQVFLQEERDLKHTNYIDMENVIQNYNAKNHGNILQISLTKGLILNVSTTKGLFMVCIPSSMHAWTKAYNLKESNES